MNIAGSLTRILMAAIVIALPGCAGLSVREPVNVNVVGIDPIQGEGLEGRFMLQLRVQNPNEQAVDYDGIYIELDVRGSRFASGVSNTTGSVPRFGEAVVAVPVTVPVTAIVRQAFGLAAGDLTRVDYELRGRLAGTGVGGVSFRSKGELTLPATLSGASP